MADIFESDSYDTESSRSTPLPRLSSEGDSETGLARALAEEGYELSRVCLRRRECPGAIILPVSVSPCPCHGHPFTTWSEGNFSPDASCPLVLYVAPLNPLCAKVVFFCRRQLFYPAQPDFFAIRLLASFFTYETSSGSIIYAIRNLRSHLTNNNRMRDHSTI